MEKIHILILSFFVVFYTSCVDDFIEAPELVGLDINQVFSSAKNAEGAIALAYAYNLSSGLPVYDWNPPYIPFGTGENYMGGEDLSDVSWTYEPALQGTGMSPSTTELLAGAPLADDNFPLNYKYIRQACLVMDNIDKVPDMSSSDKEIVKAEMKGLIAFRHLEMLKRYGGIPCVNKTLTAVDYILSP